MIDICLSEMVHVQIELHDILKSICERKELSTGNVYKRKLNYDLKK